MTYFRGTGRLGGLVMEYREFHLQSPGLNPRVVTIWRPFGSAVKRVWPVSAQFLVSRHPRNTNPTQTGANWSPSTEPKVGWEQSLGTGQGHRGGDVRRGGSAGRAVLAVQ